MKKLICLLGHPKRIMRLNDCNIEKFKNENRSIAILKCKYCNKDVVVYTRYTIAKVKEELGFNNWNDIF